MRRHTLARLTVATALAATAVGPQPALAYPALEPGTKKADSRVPAEIVVTRPEGFAWSEALLGAGVAGVLLSVPAGAAALRRRRGAPNSVARATTR
jgi:hypothetical protein